MKNEPKGHKELLTAYSAASRAAYELHTMMNELAALSSAVFEGHSLAPVITRPVTAAEAWPVLDRLPDDERVRLIISLLEDLHADDMLEAAGDLLTKQTMETQAERHLT
jgi:hypothetical protein